MSEAERLFRLHALPEGSIRLHAAARLLREGDPDELVAALRKLASMRHRSLVAVAAVCAPGWLPEARRVVLRRAALAAEASEVCALFSEKGPERPAPVDAGEDEESTLGHRMAQARSSRPELLARLAATGEPQVVRNLLQNPRVTESLVLRIAARRPIAPESLQAIAQSARFSARPRIVSALVHNPHLPVGDAIRLLPRLGDRELRELARDGTLATEVAHAAAALVARRRAGGDFRA